MHVTSRILCEQTALNIAMEAAMRPIDCPSDVAVLDRIEVNVVDMALQIGVISNCVLPVASLPDAFLPLADLARGAALLPGRAKTHPWSSSNG